MFDWLRYRYKLARLKIVHRKELAEADRISADHNEPSAEKLVAVVEKRRNYDDELSSLQTSYLCNLAAKRLIPIPEVSSKAASGYFDPASKWRRRSEPSGQLLLTDEAIRELRVALRAHRRERLEIVRSWVATIAPCLTGLTGLIGAIIGLLAIILGRR